MLDNFDPTPGWKPDPGGKYELRYWNGKRWSDRVADAGFEASDPLDIPVGTDAGATTEAIAWVSQTPGWYDDPRQPGKRYWDGSRWGASAPRPAAQSKKLEWTSFQAFAVAAACGLLGLLVGIAIGSTTSDEPRSRRQSRPPLPPPCRRPPLRPSSRRRRCRQRRRSRRPRPPRRQRERGRTRRSHRSAGHQRSGHRSSRSPPTRLGSSTNRRRRPSWSTSCRKVNQSRSRAAPH